MVLFDRWVEESGIVKCTRMTPHDYVRYIQTGRNAGKYYGRNRPPEADHDWFFRDAVGRIFYVYHPYTPFRELSLMIGKWGRENALLAFTYDSPSSWYYPGGTCVVIITAKEEEYNERNT